jgi:hypothetical protein
MGETSQHKSLSSNTRGSQSLRSESAFKPIPRQSKLRPDVNVEEDPEEGSEDASISASKDETNSSEAELSDTHAEDVSSATRGYGTRSKSRKAKAAGNEPVRSRRSVSVTAAASATDYEKTMKMKLRPRLASTTNDVNWENLELALPSIPVPVTSGLSLPTPKSFHASSLYVVDNKAPVMALIDSPALWRASAAPLHNEYLQTVLLPAFNTKHDPKSTMPTPSRSPSRAGAQSSSAADSSATSTTTNAAAKPRKKRAREAEGIDDSNTDLRIADPALDPPVSKRSKSREKSDNAAIDTDGIDEEAEEGAKLGVGKRRRKPDAGDIKRDSDGKPTMPLKFGSLEVMSLGKVMVGNDRFWSRRYIFPVGYVSRRPYYSVKFPDTKCYYVQELLASETEPISPVFKLTCEDEPDRPIYGSSASSVWATLLDRIRPQREQIMGRPLNSSISGPEQYGFSHPSIHSLIEALPGASNCLGHDPMSLYEKKTLKEG